MASGFASSARPLRNAVLISNEDKTHLLDAISCRIVCLPSRVKVGASRATSVSLGSIYPRTTSLALALRPCTLPSAPSTGFHVNTQRDRKICSGLRDFRRIGLRALV